MAVGSDLGCASVVKKNGRTLLWLEERRRSSYRSYGKKKRKKKKEKEGERFLPRLREEEKGEEEERVPVQHLRAASSPLGSARHQPEHAELREKQ